MKTFLYLLLLLVLAGLCWGAVKFSAHKKKQAQIAVVDRLFTDKADAFMAKALEDSPALVERFGKLQGITGKGYHRPGIALITRIEIERKAQYEREPVWVRIILPLGHPSEDGTQQLVMEKWSLAKDMTGRYFLEAWLYPNTSVTLPSEIPTLTFTDYSQSSSPATK